MVTNSQRYSNMLLLTNGDAELRQEGLMQFKECIAASTTFETNCKHFFLAFKDESILLILYKETYVFDSIDEASEALLKLEEEYPEEIKILIESFVRKAV